MSNWISVDDRLPDVETEVLIAIPACGHLNIEGGKYKGDGQFFGAWCSTHGKGRSYRVSHWQPLPEPPL
jgi:hypothetical protein